MTDPEAQPRPSPWPHEVSAAFHSVLLGGWVFTVAGEIADVSDEFCRLIGLGRSELIGLKPPFPFWASATEGWAAVEMARIGGSQEIQMDLLHKDGHRVPVAFVTRDLLDADGQLRGQVSKMHDLDADQQRRLHLEESRRLLEAAQEQASLGSWAWTAGPAGGSMVWSRQIYAQLGLDPSTPASYERFASAVHPDDSAVYHRLVAGAMTRGEWFKQDHRIVRPSGEVRHVHGTAQVHMDPTGRPSVIRGTVQDITDRVVAEQRLRASQEQFRLTLAASPIGLAVVALDGRFTTVNEALCRIVGLTEDALMATSLRELSHPDDLLKDLALLDRLSSGTIENYQLDHRYRHGEGRWVWVSLHVSMVRDTDGSPLNALVQIVDIDERHRTADRLLGQSLTDPLTGLANRRAWEAALRRHLSAVHTGADTLAIAILDLDHFKAFNDTHGHPVGDHLLADTSKNWLAHLHDYFPGATLARIGGEEFALALPGADVGEAKTIVREILTLVGRDQTASAGLTQAVSSDEPSTLMTRADAALYSAKHQGRNRCEVLLTA